MEYIVVAFLFAALLIFVWGVINLFGGYDQKKSGFNWIVRGLALAGIVLLVSTFLE